MIISLWHFLLETIQLQTEMSERILHRRQSLVKSVSYISTGDSPAQISSTTERMCFKIQPLTRNPGTRCCSTFSQFSLLSVTLAAVTGFTLTQHCCCHCALSLARRLPLVLRSRLPTTSSAQQRRPDDPRQPGTAGAHNIIKCVFVCFCICLFSYLCIFL